MNTSMNMNTRTKPNRGGFTLVEMLVVVAIIGILAAILIPTLYGVVIRGKQTRLAVELNQLDMAIEKYKQKYSDYPPDFLDDALVARHLRKAFNRGTDNWANTNMTRPDGTLAQYENPPGSGTMVPSNVATLDPSEALVFWLGMLKDDPRLPLNGSGKLANNFDFDVARLIDLDGDGWYSYVPQDGNDAPYVYFDSRTYQIASIPRPTPGGPTIPAVRPYFRRVGSEAQLALKFANQDTFQILSAGLDGDFGTVPVARTAAGAIDPAATGTKVFATGEADNDPVGTPLPPLIIPYDEGDFDNQANFSDGRTFEDHME